MKLTLLSISLSILSVSAVTTAFSEFGANNQTVLEDSNGIASNGLLWGILIDTGNNGFANLQESGLSTTNLSGNTYVGGSDDYFILGDITTTSFSGAIGSATTIFFELNGSDSSSLIFGGEAFGILFSDDALLESGDSYGFYQSADTITNDNSSNEANNEFRNSPLSQEFVYSPIPETSSVALLGLAGISFLTRRKRS